MSGKRRPVLGSEKSAAAKVAKAATRTKTFVDIMSCTARALRNGWALQVERTRRDLLRVLLPAIRSPQRELRPTVPGSVTLAFRLLSFRVGFQVDVACRSREFLTAAAAASWPSFFPHAAGPRSLLLPALFVSRLTPIGGMAACCRCTQVRPRSRSIGWLCNSLTISGPRPLPPSGPIRHKSV